MTDTPEATTTTTALAEAKLRSRKTRRALENAPQLAAHLRAEATPSDGRTENGWLPYQRTPIMSHVVDAADELYVLLNGWAQSWARVLGTKPPQEALWRDRDGNDRGMRANVSPERASLLVTIPASWLLWHEAGIEAKLAVNSSYQDEVFRLVGRMRMAVGLDLRPVRTADVHEALDWPCPICTLPGLHAEYFGVRMTAAERRGEFDVHWASTDAERHDPSSSAGKKVLNAVDGIRIRCTHCGWTERPRADLIVRWLR